MNLKRMLYGSMLRIKSSIMQRMNRLQPKELPNISNLYLSINKLPLSIFIDCLVDNEFNKLIIEGKATNEQLQQAWEKIMEEYGNAVAPNEVSNKLQDVKTLARKEYQIKRIELVLDLLDKFFHA